MSQGLHIALLLFLTCATPALSISVHRSTLPPVTTLNQLMRLHSIKSTLFNLRYDSAEQVPKWHIADTIKEFALHEPSRKSRPPPLSARKNHLAIENFNEDLAI